MSGETSDLIAHVTPEIGDNIFENLSRMSQIGKAFYMAIGGERIGEAFFKQLGRKSAGEVQARPMLRTHVTALG
ncbi:hypothetical protein BXU09_18830 [Deinococcus sp. LM3]|nr:hypothetical protein BXU09_18830 [Deinococcus sp. LM3]